MDVNVEFNCVGCGRCRVGDTRLSFDEMVKLAGVFPIGTSFHSPRPRVFGRHTSGSR